MSILEIIKLSPEHTELLVRFFKEVDSPQYTNDFSPHPFDTDHAKLICNYQKRDLYYSILMNGGRIIGYGMLRGWDEGYEIPSIGICILKKYQSMGLGKLLLNLLEAVSRLNGCTKVMLKVKKNNIAARKLYENQKYIFNKYDKEYLIGLKEL